MAGDRRSLARSGAALGGLAGAALVALVAALVVAWGRPAARGLAALGYFAFLSTPVVVSTALAGAAAGWILGGSGGSEPHGPSRGAAAVAAACGLVATVPSQWFAFVVGGNLGGAWGEQLLGRLVGVPAGFLAGTILVATPLIAAAAVLGGLLAAHSRTPARRGDQGREA